MRNYIFRQLVAFDFRMMVAKRELKTRGSGKIDVKWPTLVGWPDASRFYAGGTFYENSECSLTIAGVKFGGLDSGLHYSEVKSYGGK